MARSTNDIYKATANEFTAVKEELQKINPDYVGHGTSVDSNGRNNYLWTSDYIASIKEIKNSMDLKDNQIISNEAEKTAVEDAIKEVAEEHGLIPEGGSWPEDIDWPTDIVDIIKGDGWDLDSDGDPDMPSYDKLLDDEEAVDNVIIEAIKDIKDAIDPEISDEDIGSKEIDWPKDVVDIIKGDGWDIGNDEDGDGTPDTHIDSFTDIINDIKEDNDNKAEEIATQNKKKAEIAEAVKRIIAGEETNSVASTTVMDQNLDWDDIINAITGPTSTAYSDNDAPYTGIDIDQDGDNDWHDSIQGIIDEYKKKYSLLTNDYEISKVSGNYEDSEMVFRYIESLEKLRVTYNKKVGYAVYVVRNMYKDDTHVIDSYGEHQYSMVCIPILYDSTLGYGKPNFAIMFYRDFLDTSDEDATKYLYFAVGSKASDIGMIHLENNDILVRVRLDMYDTRQEYLDSLEEAQSNETL